MNKQLKNLLMLFVCCAAAGFGKFIAGIKGDMFFYEIFYAIGIFYAIAFLPIYFM